MSSHPKQLDKIRSFNYLGKILVRLYGIIALKHENTTPSLLTSSFLLNKWHFFLALIVILTLQLSTIA